MNENINIAEILKDAPKETELWSPIVGEITFDRIRQDNKESEVYIIVKDSRGNFYTFMSTGELFVTDNYHGAIPISHGLSSFPSSRSRLPTGFLGFQSSCIL